MVGFCAHLGQRASSAKSTLTRSQDVAALLPLSWIVVVLFALVIAAEDFFAIKSEKKGSGQAMFLIARCTWRCRRWTRPSFLVVVCSCCSGMKFVQHQFFPSPDRVRNRAGLTSTRRSRYPRDQGRR